MQDAVKELGSLLQAKSLAVQELTRKVEVLRDTLDCTYTGTVFAKPNLSQSRIHPSLTANKIKFYSYIRKFRMEQLQSHIRGRAS
jgi:hypothetical protein